MINLFFLKKYNFCQPQPVDWYRVKILYYKLYSQNSNDNL